MRIFEKLDKRQKLLIPVVLIAMLFLAWELYQTFAGDSTPEIKNIAPMQSATEITPAANQQTSQSATGLQPLPPQNGLSDQAKQKIKNEEQKQIAKIQEQAESARKQAEDLQKQASKQLLDAQQDIIEQATSLQQNYTSLIEKYHLAQLEDKYSKTNLSILKSRLATVQARDELNKMQGVVDVTQATPELVFTQYQSGHWIALIRMGAVYQEVIQGTVLHDGSEVVDITSEKVILRKNGKRLNIILPQSV